MVGAAQQSRSCIYDKKKNLQNNQNDKKLSDYRFNFLDVTGNIQCAILAMSARVTTKNAK